MDSGAKTAKTKKKGLRVAVVGCSHGELEKMYETISYIEKRENTKVCCTFISGRVSLFLSSFSFLVAISTHPCLWHAFLLGFALGIAGLLGALNCRA